MTSNKIAYRLTLFSVFLALAVVVLGAFTRLADAGLGCPDWPTCYGHLWVPTSESDVLAANQKFADTPVEHDKTWPEQLHRIFASSLGLLILVIFALCYRAQPLPQRLPSVVVLLGLLVGGTVARIVVGDTLDPYIWIIVAAYFLNVSRLALTHSESAIPLKLPSFIAGLVVLQGLFGMWTVTLFLWPQVVTVHLMGGFATLSLLWLLLQRLAKWHWHAAAVDVLDFMRLRPLAIAALVVVGIQIMLGGWVSSNYAALACPDFPLCQGALWPNSDFSKGFNLFQDIGPNYLGGLLDASARISIHLSHRLGALVVLLVCGVLVFRLWRCNFRQAKNYAVLLGLILALQLTLGMLNIVLSLPLAVAVAHNAVGAILLLCLVTINHRLRTVVTL